MPIAVAGLNAAVDAVTARITHIALLDESRTELAGGSPAYARNAIAWDPSASAIGDNTADEAFNVPAGATVAFVGFENHLTTGAGSTEGWWPVGGQPLQAGTVEDGGDLITSYAHGLSAGHRVVVMDVAGAGVPTGATEGTVYWVLAAGLTTDVFAISATSGGAAINFSADGEIFFTRCIPEVFAAQGIYTFAAGNLDMAATLVQN
jgi:hypothetical protein